MATGNPHKWDHLQSSSTSLTVPIKLISSHTTAVKLQPANACSKCGNTKHRQGFNYPTNQFQCKGSRNIDISQLCTSGSKGKQTFIYFTGKEIKQIQAFHHSFNKIWKQYDLEEVCNSDGEPFYSVMLMSIKCKLQRSLGNICKHIFIFALKHTNKQIRYLRCRVDTVAAVNVLTVTLSR